MLSNAIERTVDHQLSFLCTELGYVLIRTEVNGEYNGESGDHSPCQLAEFKMRGFMMQEPITVSSRAFPFVQTATR